MGGGYKSVVATSRWWQQVGGGNKSVVATSRWPANRKGTQIEKVQVLFGITFGDQLPPSELVNPWDTAAGEASLNKTTIATAL